VPPPIDDIEQYGSAAERAMLTQALSCSFVGSAATIEPQLRDFIARHKPDELMIAGHFHDPAARVRSLEITSQVRERMSAAV
jgi:alkanesulfonate monooxygenase SsuD/methylene tetrahydromethanopterin reductase-like flavin-dependent oxidoreductase (luciferase family)